MEVPEEKSLRQRAHERYDNLIAYPDTEMGYEHEVLFPLEFAQVMRRLVETVADNLVIHELPLPPSLQEALMWSEEDLMNIQLRQKYAWGQIDDLLIDAAFDYLHDAFALTSKKSPADNSPSE